MGKEEKLVKEIGDYIDAKKDELLAMLKKYITFRSINKEQLLEGETTEIAECQRWLSEEMKKLAYFDTVDMYELEEGRPNVAGVKRGEGDGPSLMFNTHSDVVTVSDAQKREWTELSPFDGGVKDGKVWGRGATDMKSGGTAMLYAARAIKDLGLKLKGDLLLTYVDGEESGRAEIGCWSLIDKGYTADFAVMCEPTSMTIFNKSKGEVYYDIKVVGSSTHICNRYKTIWPQMGKQVGVNAIDKMVKIINTFSELERSWGLDFYDKDLEPGTTTLAMSMIRGGESFSAQAGECELSIASMFDPQLTVEFMKDQIEGAVRFVAENDYWMKDHPPTMSIPFPPKVPLNVDADDPAVRAMVSSFEQVTGEKPQVTPSPFVGDANYMFERGLKSVYWGPGNIDLAHGTNESVDVDEFLRAAKVYGATIINWCGVV
jgi:acetylornithine deacetylase/succinyl-diaminopimelate desuccinylase family protein